MKSLLSYICEELDSYIISDVEIHYNIICDDNILYIQALNKFSESDLQLYLDDELVQNFPTKHDLAQKFFGKNAENIYDAFIEYEKFEHINEPKDDIKIDLEWDNRYKNASNDEKSLGIFKFFNPKFIIKFEKFELKDSDKDNIEQTLIDIFKRTESSNLNKYPVQIKFDEKNIEFNNQNEI